MSDEYSVIKSDLSEDVYVSAFVYIAENVMIGKNVIIHPHVTIMNGVSIGDDVEIFPGAYIGKPPKGKALETHNNFARVLTIGNGVTIGPNAVIYYGDVIGNDTMIGDGASIRENVTIGERCIIGRNVTINYGTRIENFVKIMDLAHITARMVVHDHVFIGPHVCTADDNTFGKGKFDASGAEIFENANLGEGVRLLPKVKIGRNAVVGAGAVVTKDVEAGTTVMGVPAKLIK